MQYHCAIAPAMAEKSSMYNHIAMNFQLSDLNSFHLGLCYAWQYSCRTSMNEFLLATASLPDTTYSRTTEEIPHLSYTQTFPFFQPSNNIITVIYTHLPTNSVKSKCQKFTSYLALNLPICSTRFGLHKSSPMSIISNFVPDGVKGKPGSRYKALLYLSSRILYL